MHRILKLGTRAAVVAALACVPALAGTITSTTLASFQAATNSPTTAGFDDIAGGTVIFTGNGSGVADNITFSGTIAGGDHEFVVVNGPTSGADTTSEPNYLGTTDATSGGALFGSDSITMAFSSPTTALGLYILGGNSFDAGTFTLNIGVGTAVNSALQDTTLGDGTLAYYLGITSTTPFSSATISPTTLGGVGSGPEWNIDDITTATANGTSPTPTPEPGTFVLMATFLGALVRRRKKA
jgi:hypothetical protein